MTLNEKNQNDIFDNDLLNELGIEYEFSNEPINRFKNNAPNEEKSDQLAKLRVEIEKIEDCERGEGKQIDAAAPKPLQF